MNKMKQYKVLMQSLKQQLF